jgi:hypothetical protein
MLWATALNANFALEKAENPELPRIEAVAPVKNIEPSFLFFMYLAPSLPVKKPAKAAISHTFLNTLEVVSSIGKKTFAPGLKTTTSMGAIFSSTSLKRSFIESSSLASIPKPLAHPPELLISSANLFTLSKLLGLLTGQTL